MSGPTVAKPLVDHIPAGGFVLHNQRGPKTKRDRKDMIYSLATGAVVVAFVAFIFFTRR
jgi:hypothetical protein